MKISRLVTLRFEGKLEEEIDVEEREICVDTLPEFGSSLIWEVCCQHGEGNNARTGG
jgi:hypothetical protein